jgi:hypothetical protein
MFASVPQCRRRSRTFAALVVSTLAVGAGCGKRPPTLLDRMEKPKMSVEELRARNYDFVLRFAARVEEAAYDISNGSQDLLVARFALIWVSSAVPTVQSSAFQADPASALIDLWALCLQQEQFFDRGAGRDLFGDWQDLVVGTSREILHDVESIMQGVASEAEYARFTETITEWVADNPIESLLFTRASTVPLTTAALGSYPSGTFAAIGNMADEVRDLSARMSIYAELLPKQIRWQGAMLLSAEAAGVGVIQTMKDIERHAAEMRRMTEFLDSVPGLISTERAAVMSDITVERLAVTKELDELLNEKIALMLEAVQQERVAVMTGLTHERVATLQEFDAMATRLADQAVDRAMGQVNGAIDYFYWRAVQVLAVLIVLLLIAGFIGARIIVKRAGTI